MRCLCIRIPVGRTEYADDPDDVISANKLNMPSYVLSIDGIHKFVPNGKGGGAESTELNNRSYLKQSGQNWYDYTDSDLCGSANLK